MIMTKKCTGCKKTLNLESFHRNSNKHFRDGRSRYCTKCRRISRNSPQSKVSALWTSIRYRLRSDDNYKNVELLCTKREFIDWIKTTDFCGLHADWVESNYRQGLSPSVDRINPKGNYELTNMQIITQSENSAKDQRGTKNRLAKLNEFQVKRIRLIKEVNPALSYAKIAAMFHVNLSTVKQIVKRLTWKHI